MTTTTKTTIPLTNINRFTVTNEPCVYTIKNIINHRVYIGSSKALYTRIKYSLSCLRRGVKLPKEMLEDYRALGPECFTLSYEILPKDLISFIEKRDVALNKDKVYNIYYAGKYRDSERASKAWEQQETIRRLRFEEGLKIQEIAEVVKTSYTTLWRILQTLA